MPAEKIFRILVINPGSTTTKIAVYENNQQTFVQSISLTAEQIKLYNNIWDQFDLRLKSILDTLSRNNFDPADFSAVVGRGGLLKPLKGGTYIVNKQMLKDARGNLQGEHASNLGCALAEALAANISKSKREKIEAYIVDPPSVDEFEPLAFYSGHPLVRRRSLSHALNIHAVARRAAKLLKLELTKSNFVIAHLGGGISISPVRNGKIIDANDASSDGPFSPDRTGGLPLQPFISLCYSNKYSESEIRKMVMGQGGLLAYLNTADAGQIEERINGGDSKAKEIYEAMAYQISKEIGAMAAVLNGNIDAIVLTGGLANSKMLTSWIEDRVVFISKVIILPGEDEMLALAEGVFRVLNGTEEAQSY